MQKSLEERIKKANRIIFENKDFDEYDKNPSIFDPERQQEIENILSSYRSEKLLDVGCGTGNVLRLAAKYYKQCYGADLSYNLVNQLKKRQPELNLLHADSYNLPFIDNTFDVVSYYAILHHVYNFKSVLKESFRVLKKGGILYIDHDPNYFFGRIYNIYYRVRFVYKPGFGSKLADDSEWHHTHSGGLNPLSIKAFLEKYKFSSVDLKFRLTSNSSLSAFQKIIRKMMKIGTKICPAKSLYTHFYIIAKK